MLKQEKSEMDDFERKKILWFWRKNFCIFKKYLKLFFTDTLEKVQKICILSIIFYFEKKLAIFSGYKSANSAIFFDVLPLSVWKRNPAHSVPQGDMGLMKSTKDAVWKVSFYISKLRFSWVFILVRKWHLRKNYQK